MRWYSFVAIYFILWVFCVFLVLPWGIRTHEEAGIERVPGQADSAPHEFPAAKIAIRVTIVATILFAIFALNYSYGWVTPQMLDLFGGTAPVNES